MPAELPTGAFMPKGTFAMITLKDNTTQLLLDVEISSDHQFDSDVTDYPVETGGTISDNIRPRPIGVTIEGLVTNTPVGRDTGPIAPSLDSDAVDQSAQSAYAHLLQIYKDREPVTLRTSRGTFKNMAMSSLVVPSSSGIGDALKFTARFTQVVIIEDVRSRVAIRNAGSGKSKLGTKTPFHFEKIVVWNKGVKLLTNGIPVQSGGSLVIGSRENVWWIPNELLKPDKNGEVIPEFKPFESTKIVGSPNAGAWFHTDRKTPLTDVELVHFHKDQARDARAKASSTQQAGLQPVDLYSLNAMDKKRLVNLNETFDSGEMLGPVTTQKDNRRPYTNRPETYRITR